MLWAVLLLTVGAQAATNSVNLLWTQRYNSTNNSSERVRAMGLDSSGNVFVAGYRLAAHFDIIVVKYGVGNGPLLWEQTIPYGSPAALVVDRNGNAIVTGSAVSDGTNYFYTAKLAAADGAILWEQRYSGDLGEFGTALALDTNGNVIVVGDIASPQVRLAT